MRPWIDSKLTQKTKAWFAMKRSEYFQRVEKLRYSVCIECGKLLESKASLNAEVERVIVRRKRGPLCVLCAGLYEKFESLDEEIMMEEYLLHGLLPHAAIGQVALTEACIDVRMERLRDHLLRRTLKKSASADVATTDQLLHLIVQSGMRCAISGWPVYSGGYKWWSMSIDHVFPISRATIGVHHVSTIDNLQVTAKILNAVKLSYSQDAVVSWFNRWRAYKLRDR
ncbi:hypothetical protein BY458DRAFT_508379 [Sporodiniella umbellata]|nr:hypothetical protein BY458DRAFT_508379 [Sporodiniella umbellata]